MKAGKNRFTKIIVAAFVIVGSILSFGVKFMSDDAALAVERPTFIRVTPDNNVSILIGDTIFFIDVYGATIKALSLKEKGFRLRGDYDFFSNGDLLFYNGNEEVGILESLSQFFRIKEIRKEVASGTDGLYRCDSEMNDCKLFTDDLPALHKTFGVFIDRASDTVYLSDTTRFTLYKLDSEGVLLAQSNDGLFFPNQIHLHNNKLYVADTNHHSVKVVRSDTERFGEAVAKHKVAIAGRYTWPTEIIKTPENWWVGIADGSMKNGGIQLFDDKWKRMDVTLLKGIDAASRSLTLFGDEVWVTDWANLKIYRFDLTGEALGEFSNNEIEQVFSNSSQFIKEYEAISSNGLTAFFIVFFIGIVAAFYLEKEETLNLFKNSIDYSGDNVNFENMESPPGEGIYWIEPSMNKYRKIFIVAFVMILIYIVWGLVQVLQSDMKLDLQFLPVISLVPFMIMVFWVWYRMSKTRIGVLGEVLLVDDGQGHIGKGKTDSIKYSRSIMVVDDVVVMLGQSYRPLFPKDELEKWVFPRMFLGEQVSQWYIWKILWRQKHPTVITAIVVMGYVVLTVVTASSLKVLF